MASRSHDNAILTAKDEHVLAGRLPQIEFLLLKSIHVACIERIKGHGRTAFLHLLEMRSLDVIGVVLQYIHAKYRRGDGKCVGIIVDIMSDIVREGAVRC